MQEEATLNDANVTSLSVFRDMKGSVSALRGTADVAALLVKEYVACGRFIYLFQLYTHPRDLALIFSKNCFSGPLGVCAASATSTPSPGDGR